MGKYRMYEPYGFQEEGDYLSRKAMLYNEVMKNRANDKQEFFDIDTLYEKHNTEAFASAYYDQDLESVIFKNKNGEAIEVIKMTDIIPSTLVKSAIYDDTTQEIIITFDNDDVIKIDLNKIINNNEAGDGLILHDAKFNVLIDPQSEKFVSGTGEDFLTVSADGVKIDHIQEAIDVEKNRAMQAELFERNARIYQDNVLLGLINSEKARATSEEERIETKLDNEIADRNTHNNEHDAAIAHLQAAITSEEIARGNAVTTLNGYIASLQNEINSLKARVSALEARI